MKLSVTLSVEVIHHPSRQQRLESLLRRLDAWSPSVWTDPDPQGEPFAWRTERLALASLDSRASHVLLIQDDAVPCEGVSKELLLSIIERIPSSLIALYGGWNSINGYSMRVAASLG